MAAIVHSRLARGKGLRQRGNGAIRSALLATLIGTALAVVLFIGLSGGLRP